MFEHKLGTELMNSGKKISISVSIYLSTDRDNYLNTLIYLFVCIRPQARIHMYVCIDTRTCVCFSVSREEEWGG